MENISKEVVFAITQQKAEEKLRMIVEEYIKSNEQLLIDRKHHVRTNERDIKALVPRDNVRGYKCTTVYVDRELPIKTLDLIYPVVNFNEENIRYF